LVDKHKDNIEGRNTNCSHDEKKGGGDVVAPEKKKIMKMES